MGIAPLNATGIAPSGMRVTALAGDTAAVAALVRACGNFRDSEVEVAVELVRERLDRGAASGYEFLFADDEAGLAGYACFGPVPGTEGSFDLYWIAVHPRARGRGLGRELVCAAERRMADCGARAVYIETSSRPDYAPARALYRAAGYLEAARLPDFYAPGDDRITYVRKLELSHAR